MARDVSIAISARDNFSQAITTMRNANQAFNKDITGLQSKLDELNKTKITLKVDTDKAKRDLKDAEKQFSLTGDAADKLNLELANANYENARRNLSLVSQNAKQAEKNILNLTDAVSKSENRAGSGSGGSSIINSLAASGATKMVGDMFGSVAMTYVNSAFGAETGTMASSVMSSGAMGAAIGSAIAPGIGTAIGALGGALIGYVQGQNAIFEKKDDAFKSYYENLYNVSLEQQRKSLSSGSNISSMREANMISFETLLGSGQATGYLKSLVDFAAVTPFAYDDLVDISKTLLAYGYKKDEMLPLLEKVGNTGSALDMSTDDMKSVATSLGRMQVTDKANIRYLNPLLERGIDVYKYLAEASGKAKDEVIEMVEKGLIPGSLAAEIIAEYMGFDFAGNMQKQSKTFSGLISTLEDARIELDNSMGEGYNKTRKKGLQDEIDFLEGETGESMKDAYNYIGQWQASLENLSEQLQRDVIDSVMNGTLAGSYENSTQRESIERLMQEYATANEEYGRRVRSHDDEGARKAGADMGRILAEARAIAMNEYNASEGAQLALESNKTLAENIKNDTSLQDEYWDAGYTMGQQFTLGLASATLKADSFIYSNTAAGGLAKRYVDAHTGSLSEEQIAIYRERYREKNHAYGLNYVPYDNYPALLHQGERVLTASENRSNKSAIPVNITGNTFVVRTDDDIKGIAHEIVKLFERAYALAP